MGPNDDLLHRPLDLGSVPHGHSAVRPRLGRFLEVDPVEGGSANDYEYGKADAVNNVDLDGRIVAVIDWRNCEKPKSKDYDSSSCERYRARPQDHVVPKKPKPVWCRAGGYLVVGGGQGLGYALGGVRGLVGTAAKGVTGPWGWAFIFVMGTECL